MAQIDHLLINRAFGIYLLETKNYAGNLVINDHGEFTVEYDSGRFGIPSPIEQSLRHERLLGKLLQRLEIVGRTQTLPQFCHVVMLHPKAIIERPSLKAFDTSNVIKADQFPTWHQKFVDKVGVGTVLTSMLNLRSLDTIKEWGEKLMRQHRPADLFSLPDFMKPREPSKQPPKPVAAVQVSSVSAIPAQPPMKSEPDPVAAVQPAAENTKRLICAHCSTKISYAEGKFCWNNSKRFGGSQYCREHQGLF